jgi:hypothetical protein
MKKRNTEGEEHEKKPGERADTGES